ncbi:MAG: bifunctional folylpolyglutamate synthase/dihydrofolate synthase [Thermomicrobiales bacterium]
MPSTPAIDPAYRRALAILWNRSAWERGLITDPFGGEEAGLRGLRRMRALLDALGAPDRVMPLLHVAGSKGKGSTAAFAAASLTASGRKTGLYTSPHLHGFNERIAIDGAPSSQALFGSLAVRTDEAASRLESAQPELGTISTFELVTAMAFLGFAEASCDAAVIEVGLGGAWDATNVIDPLACAITRIDLEHTAILGSTLAEIAAAKAGIIKPGRPVAIGPDPLEAESVLVAAAERAGSTALLANRDWSASGSWRSATLFGPWGEWREVALSLPGDHQVENAGIAAAALWLMGQAGLPVNEQAIRDGFAGAVWPGRFEQISAGTTRVVLDGAHTPAAAAALRRALEAEFPDESAVFVLGMAGDKAAEEIIAALAPVASAVIAVRADNPRSLPPEAIAAAAGEAGIPSLVAGSVAAGVETAAGQPLVVITGSLFVVGDAREALGQATPDPHWGPELAEGQVGRVK